MTGLDDHDDARLPLAVAPALAPQGETTGDDAVDEAMTRLDLLDGAPLAEHVAIFDAVHAALQDRLADIES